MLLIADSGSTKCDWRLIVSPDAYHDFKSMGINPYFHNEDAIETELLANEHFMTFAKDVSMLFFYGAGCSSPVLKRIVHRGLSRVFENAEIYVDHDLVAAAFSVYDDESCIACILGTGSNSCHFDGDIVREEVPALAYILGDEGSGSYFGKKVLADFLYKRLPIDLHEALVDEFLLTKDKIVDRVYMKPNANVYLASFMKLITRFKHEPYVHKMIKAGLGAFLDTHVLCFRDAREIPVHFIGSVAYYHEDILREAAAERGIRIGKIIKKPIDGLHRYHEKEFFSKKTI